MEAFIGTILPFGFSFAPLDWAFCAGQQVGISQNTALFALIGTYYGGNGTTTFGLPDLQGRAIVGQGQGPGLTDRIMGEADGTESTSMLISNMPMHTHAATFTPTGSGGTVSVSLKASANQDSESIPGTNGATTLAAPYYNDGSASVTGYVADANPTVPLTGVTVAGGGSTGTVTNAITGGSIPFEILQPFLTVNYCICLYGIFPSRN